MANTLLLNQGQEDLVVNAATATGTAKSVPFAVQHSMDGDSGSLSFTAIGAGAQPTAVTADIEKQDPTSGTWVKYQIGIVIIGASAVPAATPNSITQGIYRLNLTTLTLGTATSVTINATYD